LLEFGCDGLAGCEGTTPLANAQVQEEELEVLFLSKSFFFGKCLIRAKLYFLVSKGILKKMFSIEFTGWL
jgi:hypothetical protein